MGTFSLVKDSKASSLAVMRRKSKEEDLDLDQRLIAECLRGEERSMELLYNRYKRRVFGVVMRIVGPSDADEVAQEAFIRIFKALAKFRGDSKFSTWVYRLSVNAALTHVSKRRMKTVSDEVLLHKAAPQAPRRDSALSSRLEEALARLSPGYRAALVLHDVEGLSHEECAKILKCRVGTSKSQLHKARAKMRVILAEMNVGPEELRS